MDSLPNESLYAAQIHFYLQRFSLLQFNFQVFESVNQILLIVFKLPQPPRNGLTIPELQHLSFPIIASQIWDFHADYHITSSINTWTTHQEPVLKAGKGITHHEQPQDLCREAHTRPHKSSKIMLFFIYRYISAQITHFIYLNYIFLIQLCIQEYTTHYNIFLVIYYSHYFIL